MNPIQCLPTPNLPTQIYEGGRGLGFHFDKDEHAMAEEGRMVNPILSSVLYLTGGRGDSLRQARARAAPPHKLLVPAAVLPKRCSQTPFACLSAHSPAPLPPLLFPAGPHGAH